MMRGMGFGTVEFGDEMRGVILHAWLKFPKVVFLAIGKFPSD